MDFEEEVLIPKARVAVLIGIKGFVKKDIERRGKIKLKIRTDGTVTILSNDAVNAMVVKNIVEAIGRGFNPEIAKQLFKEENSFELIHLEDYVGKGKDLERIRGVLIGKGGKARRVLEESTGTHVSIYGKTVAIIGRSDKVAKARKAVEMFLTGARHATVYKFLGAKDGG